MAGWVTMAKKDYSADALIQADVNQQLESQRQDPLVPQEEQKAIQAPVVALTSGGVDSSTPNPTPIGGGMRGSQYVTSSPVDNAPKPKPFMAVNQTADGRPMYGTGFQGWARKLWADIADPAKLLQDTQKLSEEESSMIWDSYNERVEETATVLEDKFRWDKWGEKIFGITAEEVGALTAGGRYERETAELTGDSQAGTAIARTVAIARDTTQNVIWAGLDILSLDDVVMRKIHSTVQGLDAVADKFNKDSPSNFFEELLQGNALSVGKDLYTVSTNILKGNITYGEVSETLRNYRAGSAMAYTMVFDEFRRNEFDRLVAEGGDPQVVAQDLGLIGTEITGSILGSPSTYLGLAIKAPVNILTKAGREAGDVLTIFNKTFGHLPWRTLTRIPTFGEVVRLNVGRARLANEALRFTEQSTLLNGLEPIIKNIDTAVGERQAIKILENATNFFVKKMDDLSSGKLKFNSMATLDSNGRVAVTARDSSTFTQAVVKQHGIDGSLQILRDLVIVKRGGSQAVEAGARLLGHNNANILTSDVALMTGEVLNRLDTAKIFKVIEDFGDNPVMLQSELFNKLDGALHDLIPSVDDMWDASRKIKDIGKNIPVDANELKAYTRNVELAEQWKNLHPVIKTIRTVTKVPENIAKKTTAIMTYAYMNLVPRSWTRDLMGTSWAIASQQGFRNAIETTVTALLGINKKATVNVVDSINSDIVKKIGILPSQSARKVNSFTGTKSWGMMNIKGQSEDITSAQTILNSINDTIQKSIPVVVKNNPEYQAFMDALPKEQQALFYNSLRRSYGNWQEAETLFKNATKNGEIEAWRLTEPSEHMRRELQRYGMEDTFYKVQAEVKTMDEFTSFVDNFITTYTDEVTKAAQKLPSVTSMPEELLDWSSDLKQIDNKTGSIIRELNQGWTNTLNELQTISRNVFNQAEQMVNQIPDINQRTQALTDLQTIRKRIEVLDNLDSPTYNRMNTMRDEVVGQIKKLDGMTPQELTRALDGFQVIYEGKVVFSLKKIYPDLDFTTLTPQKAKSLMWEAMFESTSSVWKSNKLGRYNATLDSIEQITQLVGSNIDTLAQQSNAMRKLDDMRRITMQLEDAHAWDRFFRSVNFKPDIDLNTPVSGLVDEFKKVHPDWGGTPAYLLNKANDDAGKLVTPIPTDVADAWKVEQGYKGEVREIKDKMKKLPLGMEYTRLVSRLKDLEAKAKGAGFEVSALLKKNNITRTELNSSLTTKVDKTKPPANYNDMTLADAIDRYKTIKRVPPYDPNTMPNDARSAWEGMKKFTQDIRDWSDTVVGGWGKKVPTIPTQIDDLMKTAGKSYKDRWDVVQLNAGVVAEAQRNFIMHDYQRTYLDHALTLGLGNSFHYWTTRTYTRAFETLLENPKYANMYLQYKEFLQKQHSDQPEWYRQNLEIKSLFGIDLANPYYVNLEAAINPIYGLTGTDFNDPRKRVDWLSRTIDDMGKMGPSFSPLVSWAIAMHLYNKGEEDAATRWTNRLLPQSPIIKSGTALLDNVLQKFGIDSNLSPVEVDPFTTFMDGGVDPYERNRVASALAIMVRDGAITPEQMIEASRLKEGDIWNQAVELSAEKRFMGDFTSFFFGAGIRPRTQDDLVIEKFWNDYGSLIASRDMMTAEQYRNSWDKLRDNPEYGMFVDALLISRKAGTEQDTAYAYNVLGRIPPGGMSQVAEAVGINPDMLQAFYDNKGDFTEMGLTPQDQARFMAGLVDIGAILTIPDGATRQEWTEARVEYQTMKEVMEKQFGNGITEAIDGYYDADNRSDYLELNPEVQQAMDWQTQYVLENPSLNKFYGGIDSVQQYYRTATENILLKEFGKDKAELYDEYSDPHISPERKKELSKILKPYLSRRKELKEQNLRAIVDIGRFLPDTPRPTAQENINPKGVYQNNLFELTQPPKTPQEWQEIVGESTMSLLQDYLYNDEEIPPIVTQNLDYIAEREGYFSGDEMMQEILMSLPQGQAQP